MSSSDTGYTLSEDTKLWLATLTGPSKLHPSYFRILILLREINTSASEISKITGIGVPRVRQRLKSMVEYGYVEIAETLSDKTVIWGLVEPMRRPDVISHPTEATILERRGRQASLWTNELGPSLTSDWGVPTTPKPGKAPKRPKLDISSLKQYEAGE